MWCWNCGKEIFSLDWKIMILTNLGIVIDSAYQRAPQTAVIFGFKQLAEIFKFRFPSLFQSCYPTNLEVF